MTASGRALGFFALLLALVFAMPHPSDGAGLGQRLQQIRCRTVEETRNSWLSCHSAPAAAMQTIEDAANGIEESLSAKLFQLKEIHLASPAAAQK